MIDRAQPTQTEPMHAVALAALEDAKGEQISLLDVRKLTDITDYMIVVTGTSQRHVRTLAERVQEKMLAAGWKPLGTEGDREQEWVLVDFVEVVIHIMRASARQRYALESLWDETLSALLRPDDDQQVDAAQVGVAKARDRD